MSLDPSGLLAPELHGRSEGAECVTVLGERRDEPLAVAICTKGLTGNNRIISGRASCLIVMAGLVPAIRSGTLPRRMAGTSPAMTEGTSGDGRSLVRTVGISRRTA